MIALRWQDLGQFSLYNTRYKSSAPDYGAHRILSSTLPPPVTICLLPEVSAISIRTPVLPTRTPVTPTRTHVTLTITLVTLTRVPVTPPEHELPTNILPDYHRKHLKIFTFPLLSHLSFCSNPQSSFFFFLDFFHFSSTSFFFLYSLISMASAIFTPSSCRDNSSLNSSALEKLPSFTALSSFSSSLDYRMFKV